MLENGNQTEDGPRNRAEGPATASSDRGGRQKFGWRIGEWCDAVGCCRATAYNLIAKGLVDSQKLGRSRIIRTHPADFLDSQR
jgi:hypothetical protein